MRNRPELSLMIINLLTEIFLDEHFQPRKTADRDAYDRVLQIAEDAGFPAVDITDMENDFFGTDEVRRMLRQHDLSVGSIILFENYTTAEEKEQARVYEHTCRTIDHAAALDCRTLMLVCARLRHVAGSNWGIKRYMNMDHLLEMDNEQEDSLAG